MIISCSSVSYQFYLIINLAVGGTNGFFPDEAVPGKPWSNLSPTAFRDFWNARGQWYPTWEGEEAALQVDYVKVWSLDAPKDPSKQKQ